MDGLRRRDDGKPDRRVAGRTVRLVCRPRCAAGRRALHRGVAKRAGDRALGERGAGRCRQSGDLRVRCASTAADRAAHLALLRDVRHRRRQHAAAGQLPGGSRARRRPSDIADQYRSSPALDCRCPRLWLDRHVGGRGTSRGNVCDPGAPEAFPRPFLQLVRYVRSSSARAGLHFLGRQRQPGRPPDRARQRLRHMAGQPCRCTRRRRRRERQPGARP